MRRSGDCGIHREVLGCLQAHHDGGRTVYSGKHVEDGDTLHCQRTRGDDWRRGVATDCIKRDLIPGKCRIFRATRNQPLKRQARLRFISRCIDHANGQLACPLGNTDTR